MRSFLLSSLGGDRHFPFPRKGRSKWDKMGMGACASMQHHVRPSKGLEFPVFPPNQSCVGAVSCQCPNRPSQAFSSFYLSLAVTKMDDES